MFELTKPKIHGFVSVKSEFGRAPAQLSAGAFSSMASINSTGKSSRFFSSQSYHSSTCGRTHQIAALALVVVTFFLTRLLDRSLGPCPSSLRDSFFGDDQSRAPEDVVRFGLYGAHLNLKIYVYDEDEIDGLKLLMYGREGKISADACVRGQWGTQVKIHRLLLQSTYRTRKKEEADLFFVPSYVKCVRMMGGLNDKEINQTYVKVLSQMPYFRISGGRNHIFVFPRYVVLWCWSSLVQVLVNIFKSFYNFDPRDENIEEMIVKGRRVRCLWVYAPESEPCSALSGILWELQKKVRKFQHSSETFWLHNGSIVNRDLVEFSKWT
ncbi:exostosin family protein [Striga asiatica]|uniref:Exostosin family protein n=1 Tax=Striga asiatica TaxID=4170 RepID=A0A5A7QSL0_STRAF|nr:exostosin family protein [Striga asiatica]